jgi:hypothetical protein
MKRDALAAADDAWAKDRTDPASVALPAPQIKRRFRPIRFRDVRVSADRPYLVKGLIPREGLAVVWGPPKCGKTFWTFDVGMHVALGWEYRGRRVQQGTVVYVACEGERGLGARVEAFRIHRLNETEDAEAPFFLLPTRLDLVADAAELIRDIRAEIDAGHCVLIVIDTLNRSISGSESKDEDMSAYIKAADQIREAFSCAVVIIHHCGINGDRPRGHTSLTGAADAQIAVKRDAEGIVVTTVEYMKDGPEGDQITSRLLPVKVGTDEDGEPITSLIVDPSDGQSASDGKSPSQKPAKLTATAKTGLEQLRNCLAEHSEPLPASPHIPAGFRGVTLTYWRGHLEKAGVINSDGNPREQFRRIRVTLQSAGIIGVWDDFVWLSHTVT